jgi:hypothetical protein
MFGKHRLYPWEESLVSKRCERSYKKRSQRELKNKRKRKKTKDYDDTWKQLLHLEHISQKGFFIEIISSHKDKW